MKANFSYNICVTARGVSNLSVSVRGIDPSTESVLQFNDSSKYVTKCFKHNQGPTAWDETIRAKQTSGLLNVSSIRVDVLGFVGGGSSSAGEAIK